MASDSDDGDSNLISTLLPQEGEEEEKTSKANGDDYSNIYKNQHQQPLEQPHYLRSIQATLTTRQLPSQGLSFQLWPAASTLASLLDRSPSSLLLPHSPPTLSILELGSGTGLAGMAAAAILGARVTLTDLPHVLPNLRSNAEANAGLITARGGSVEVRRLIWGDDEDHASVSSPSRFDVVMASDVVYHEHLIDPLLRTLVWFVRGEVVLVMAHLRRWRKRDAVFFRKAKRLFDFGVVHRDPPLPGSRIGVAVYRFTAKNNAT